MPSEDIERRLAAILSADVVGYSRLMAEDEDATIRVLGTYREQIGLLVSQHHGRVVDFTGDNFLAEFPSALDAVQAAVEIQEVLRARNTPLAPDRRMEFRIGVHLGDVRVEGERIFGDGVNIAARLEGLAEPGGICVSQEVHGQVRNKLDAGFEDLGDQAVKNIPEPVRVYRLITKRSVKPTKRRRSKLTMAALHTSLLLAVVGFAIWLSWPRPLGLVLDFYGLSELPTNPPLPDKPSLVVLPFDNISPQEDYFARGLTEDLTARLSGISNLFVISRHSAEAAKERLGTIEEIGRALGVRYVLEGSVQRAGDQVRVTAQLIEAATDHHLWYERYDRELLDIFSLQAEVAEDILSQLSVQIHETELARIRRRPTSDLSAYELFLKGRSLAQKETPRAFDEARELFERAVELDPSLADAYGGQAVTYNIGRPTDDLERAESLARQAISIDPLAFYGHVALANVLIAKGKVREARLSAETGADLAPGDGGAQIVLALARMFDGSILEGLRGLREAVRHDPDPTPSMLGVLGSLNYQAGRTSQAVELWERARASSPGTLPSRCALIYYYETSGEHDRAREIVNEILRSRPGISVANLRGFGQGLSDHPASYLNALRAAGIPDEPQPTPTDLSGRPSIIVLPFDNLSGDPEQEYFADGITEDLTTALSRTRDLMVLSRNTAFTYKGQAVTPQQLREELGVRYVIEGSVQRGGNRFRINAQLIESESGGHVWADGYERELTEVFEVQGEIVEEIFSRLNVELLEWETRRLRHKPTRDLSAYELFIKARRINATGFTRKDQVEAFDLLERATELDPDYADALAFFGGIIWGAYSGLWMNVARDEQRLAEGEARVERALKLDPLSAYGHAGRSAYLFDRNELQEALAEVLEALRLQPNESSALFLLAGIRMRLGHWERAEAALDLAESLDPRFSNPGIWRLRAALEHRHGNTDRALRLWERCRQVGPLRLPSRFYLIDHYEAEGDEDLAESISAEIVSARPDIASADIERLVWALEYKPRPPDQMLANLLKAGLP